MAKKPTVFISYRRDPSADLARHIYDKLKSRGANVFLDVEAINGGRFEAIIEREIILRDYFLVLLTPNTLDSEWVRREIATALRHQKKIIPVSARGFSLATASLPQGLEELAQYDEIRYDTEYSDASINRIAIAIDLNVNVTTNLSMRSLVGGLVVVLGLLFGLLALFSEEWRNDFFYKLGFYTATPLAIVQNPTLTPTTENPTHTPQPPTETPTNTDTPQPTSAPTQTTVPPTNTDSPTPIPESVSLAVDPLVVQRGQNVNITTSGTICTFNPSNGSPFTIQTSSGNIIWPAERQPGTTIDVYCEKDSTRSATITFQIMTSTTTPNPPTNTPVPATPTTPAPSGDTITLTIFRDQDSLTLYMPKTDQPLSLAGLVFQVEITGQNRQFPLIGYSSFGGNSILGNVSILNSAACFRLARSGSRSPAPLECQNGALPLTQNVADADVFWYDSTANQHRTVLVLRDGGTIMVCAAGQTRCDTELPLAAAVEVVNVAASSTATPGYPCEGTIGASQSSIRNIVRSDPVSTASIIAGVAPGTQVLILEARQEGTKTRWYRIGYEPDTPIGWIRYDYLDLSPACPQ